MPKRKLRLSTRLVKKVREFENRFDNGANIERLLQYPHLINNQQQL